MGLRDVLSKLPIQGGLTLTGDQDQMDEMQTEAALHTHMHTLACASHHQSRICNSGPSGPHLEHDTPRLISS